MKRSATTLFLLLGLSCASGGWAQQQDRASLPDLKGLAVGVGLEYEEGDYDTGDTTELWRIPFSVSYSTEKWYLNATIPYLSAESDGALVVRSSTHHISTRPARRGRTESGLGDITLSATRYLAYNRERNLEPFVRGRIKLGTADEDDGLGTGESDVAGEFGVNIWRKPNRYYAALGYELVGDPPGVDYDNVFYAYTGVSRRLNERQRIGVDLYYSESSTPGFDDALELSGYVNQRLDAQRTLHAYLLAGLTDGSPDWGGGVGLKWYLP